MELIDRAPMRACDVDPPAATEPTVAFETEGAPIVVILLSRDTERALLGAAT